MHIKPYLGEEIGRGKSGFAVNRGTVNRYYVVLSTMLVIQLVTHSTRKQNVHMLGKLEEAASETNQNVSLQAQLF